MAWPGLFLSVTVMIYEVQRQESHYESVWRSILILKTILLILLPTCAWHTQPEYSWWRTGHRFFLTHFVKVKDPWDALKNSNRQVKTSLFHFRSDIDGMCPLTPPSRSLTVIKIRKRTRFKSGWREKCESDIHPVMHGHACSLMVLQLVYGDSQFISKETIYIIKYTVAHQALQLKRLWNYQVSQWPDWLTSGRPQWTHLKCENHCCTSSLEWCDKLDLLR